MNAGPNTAFGGKAAKAACYWIAKAACYSIAEAACYSIAEAACYWIAEAASTPTARSFVRRASSASTATGQQVRAYWK